jgi:glucose-6-phosphate dehydrogenase assembly protein OpcA
MPVHVDTLDDVASILERLCKSRAGAGPGAAVAATMNFVVFIDDDAHRRWVLERAERIAEKHPSRMIVLDSTHAIKGVDVSCGSSEGTGATIRNERLDLGIAALDHESIVATAHQLTIREIPTVLWWSGARLLESRTFLGLAENADVVVIDSSGKAHDEETLAELCTFAERHPHVALHDLAFLRLAPWQEMIAQFFDDPALRADLFALSAVEIESGSAAEALYLGAWIGSRIAWEALDSHTFRTRDGRSLSFERIKNGEQRRILRVTLRSDHSTYAATLCGERVVRLSVEGANARPPWLVSLHAVSSTSLIERAILAPGADKMFEATLATLRGLMR